MGFFTRPPVAAQRLRVSLSVSGVFSEFYDRHSFEKSPRAFRRSPGVSDSDFTSAAAPILRRFATRRTSFAIRRFAISRALRVQDELSAGKRERYSRVWTHCSRMRRTDVAELLINRRC